MSRGVRPVPALALTAAGLLALGPAVAAPATPGVAVPVVHVEQVQLAGIGQEIYDAITPVVQYAVGGVSYLINFTPVIGAPIAAQVNINYYQGVQPLVAATVDYLAAVVADPLNVVTETGIYADQIYRIGYGWVSAELRFFGFSELPPLPPTAAVRASVTPVQEPSRRRAAPVQVSPAAVLDGANGTGSRPRVADVDVPDDGATAAVSRPRERVRATRQPIRSVGAEHGPGPSAGAPSKRAARTGV